MIRSRAAGAGGSARRLPAAPSRARSATTSAKRRTHQQEPSASAIDRIEALGLVPVVEIDDPAQAVPLAMALRAAGLLCAEITFRTAAAGEAMRAIRDACPEILLGAGTVLTTEQVDAALTAGASFLVAPGFNPAVVDHALEVGATILPGVCTPSEIEAVMARGLLALKFFPAEAAGGVAFLKAVAPPYPSARFVPTGGINPSNLPDYLVLPNVAACGGSWMVRRQLIAAGDFGAIQRLAAEALAVVAMVRSKAVTTPASRASTD